MLLGVDARNRQVSGPVRRVERDPGAEWDADAWWAGIPAVRTVLDAGLNLPPGVTFRAFLDRPDRYLRQLLQ
jgi:hypothetical protein